MTGRCTMAGWKAPQPGLLPLFCTAATRRRRGGPSQQGPKLHGRMHTLYPHPSHDRVRILSSLCSVKSLNAS